jgi:small-conductance mechanosensitive channel
MSMADARLYRRATASALVIGPGLFFLDNLIHPKEVARGNEAEQLRLIAADADRWQVAHLVGFLGLIAICAAVLGLAWVARRSSPVLGLWAGAAGVVGALGFAFAFALDGYTWGVLGEVSGRAGSDPATIEAALGEIQQSNWSLPYYALAVVGFVGGMLALAWGLARGAWVSRWAAALLGLGALAVAIEGTIASNAYFVGSSGLFLIGAAAVARELSRVPDTRLAALPGA